MRKSNRNSILLLFITFLVIISTVGCNFPVTYRQPTAGSQDSSTDKDKSLTTFRVSMAQPLPPGDSIYLYLLDEVTGLAFNPSKYVMTAENASTYSVTLPLDEGSVVKYRYFREGSGNVGEHLYNGRPVRFRLYHVEGSKTLADSIRRWTDTDRQGPYGKIVGQLVDSSTGSPIPDILVSAGGEQTFSLADGTFFIDGLLPGEYNLVFYSLDGSYNIYQQGAVIAGDSITPVYVQLDVAELVTVIFSVTVPGDTPADAPVRMAGNITQLGNTFADLSGGVSTLASRMPVLDKLPDGRYILTIRLPAGTYLEYKYTLGDGLWSSELNSSGGFNVRRVIVPDDDIELADAIETWHKDGFNPIELIVTVPEITPDDEEISIQLNPGFGWLEPLPMWRSTSEQGESSWKYVLTGPFNDVSGFQYRYCRQGQCGIADDEATAGMNPTGRLLSFSANQGTVEDEVLRWAWLDGHNELGNIPVTNIPPRGLDFFAGVALQTNYHPSWAPILPQAIDEIKALMVNWLVLTPTWTFTNNTYPILEALPSQDMLMSDLVATIATAQKSGLSVALFPSPNFNTSVDSWWQHSIRDNSWWNSFFESYTNFILHHATLAATSNASSLILGGDWLSPALPSGLVADGSASNVPQDAERYWNELIAQVRQRFSGNVYWATPYSGSQLTPPDFLDAVDGIVIMWSAPLSDQPGASMEEMYARANSFMNEDILPIYEQDAKPVIISFAYSSIQGAAVGCIPSPEGGCLDNQSLSWSHPDIPGAILDMQEQVNAYNALLSAINENYWISGFISMGYYPPAAMEDKSSNIHGKPASSVVWYWSQKLLGR